MEMNIFGLIKKIVVKLKVGENQLNIVKSAELNSYEVKSQILIF